MILKSLFLKCICWSNGRLWHKIQCPKWGCEVMSFQWKCKTANVFATSSSHQVGKICFCLSLNSFILFVLLVIQEPQYMVCLLFWQLLRSTGGLPGIIKQRKISIGYFYFGFRYMGVDIEYLILNNIGGFVNT